MATSFTADDGAALPAANWLPSGTPRAVIVGVHGINDYRATFAGLGEYLSKRGFAVYAYDQRGYGATSSRGHWAGGERLARDLGNVTRGLHARYPGLPLYIIGASLGATVATVSVTEGWSHADALVLSAPAVLTRTQVGPIPRGLLWLGANLLPRLRFTSAVNGLARDRQLVARLRADPLVLHSTSLAALDGSLHLMQYAEAAAKRISIPTLVLHGAQDRLIPTAAVRHFARAIPHATRYEYPEGRHLLLRDRGAQSIWHDILGWLERGITRPQSTVVTSAELLSPVAAIHGKPRQR